MSTTELAQPGAQALKRNYSFLFALTLLGLLAALCIVLTIANPIFMTDRNISNLLRQGSMIAILAVGQTFVIITAGIDLSVGAIVGFSTVVIALLIQAGVPTSLAVLITLVVGARHRHVPRLWHHQDGPAAVHHHPGHADLAARDRAGDDQRLDHLDQRQGLHRLRNPKLSRASQACSGW